MTSEHLEYLYKPLHGTFMEFLTFFLKLESCMENSHQYDVLQDMIDWNGECDNHFHVKLV